MIPGSRTCTPGKPEDDVECPLVPLALVEYMERRFLDATPRLDSTPQEIGFALGKREVALWIRGVYEDQNVQSSD